MAVRTRDLIRIIRKLGPLTTPRMREFAESSQRRREIKGRYTNAQLATMLALQVSIQQG